MTTLAPVSVALKFGFLAVLYLFLLWVARSARRDLRGAGSATLDTAGERGGSAPPDATGLYSASAPGVADLAQPRPAAGRRARPRPRVRDDLRPRRGHRARSRRPGRDPARGSRSPPHATPASTSRATSWSSKTSRSTNGTYLNEELLETPAPLHPGDRVRIGDSEFTFEVD